MHYTLSLHDSLPIYFEGEQALGTKHQDADDGQQREDFRHGATQEEFDG